MADPLRRDSQLMTHQQITRERVQEAQRKVAHFMVKHGMEYLAPIYNRLERELKAMDNQSETLEAAKRLLERVQ